jgi:hypothetical protein
MSEYNDTLEDLMDEMAAEQGRVQVPVMRTFRVLLEDTNPQHPLYVQAHSFVISGKSARFYNYQAGTHEGRTMLVAYPVRALRPYVDVADVTSEVAVGSKGAN